MKSLKVSSKKPADQGQRQKTRKTFACLLCFAICFLTLSCASTPKLPPPAPRYVYEKHNQAQEAGAPLAGTNSLWRDSASLYEDVKARRLNDLLTINVVENISGSGTANTATDKTSSTDGAVNNVFGIPTNLGMANLFGKGFTFSPTVNGSMTDSFKGDGSTTRAGSLIGTITAKVVEVMPNGNLAIESRKDITINNEKQTLILRGMVRPDDVAPNNTILSSQVADAEVYFVGDGVVQSKQDTGWFDKILDKIWPF